MEFFSLKKHLSLESNSTYLLEGEEKFFLQSGTTFLKEKYLLNGDELNLTVYDGNVKIDEIISSLENLTFFSDKRLVIVKEYYPKDNDLKKLNEYLKNPSTSSVLVVVNEKKSETLSKNFQVVVDCKRAGNDEIKDLIKRKFAKNNRFIPPDNLQRIIDYCLGDLLKISLETDKLIAYVDENEEVNKKAIDLIVARDTDFKVYELTNKLMEKNFEGAYEIYRDLISKNEKPQYLLVAMFSHFRRVLLACATRESDKSVADKFKVKEYAVKMMRKNGLAYGKRNLKRAVDYLTALDEKLKLNLIDDKVGMEMALHFLTK